MGVAYCGSLDGARNQAVQGHEGVCTSLLADLGGGGPAPFRHPPTRKDSMQLLPGTFPGLNYYRNTTAVWNPPAAHSNPYLGPPRDAKRGKNSEKGRRMKGN